MSASLVGSEMCIRDRTCPQDGSVMGASPTTRLLPPGCGRAMKRRDDTLAHLLHDSIYNMPTHASTQSAICH
eukprot:13237155-Alexandrium_andersonii.AAC.1